MPLNLIPSNVAEDCTEVGKGAMVLAKTGDTWAFDEGANEAAVPTLRAKNECVEVAVADRGGNCCSTRLGTIAKTDDTGARA